MLLFEHYLAYLILLSWHEWFWPRDSLRIPKAKIKKIKLKQIWKKPKRKLINTLFSFQRFCFPIYSGLPLARLGVLNVFHSVIIFSMWWKPLYADLFIDKAGKFVGQRHVINGGICQFVYNRRFYCWQNVDFMIGTFPVAWFSGLKVIGRSINTEWKILKI